MLPSFIVCGLSSEERRKGPSRAQPSFLRFIASVSFLGEVLGLFVVGRIDNTEGWLFVKGGAGTWQDTMLRSSTTEGPAPEDSESLTWSHLSEEPIAQGNSWGHAQSRWSATAFWN